MKLRRSIFNTVQHSPYPNYWDVAALVLVFSIFAAVAFGAKAMAGPYHLGQQIPISLDPSYLPGYALRTVFRMFIAMAFSLLFCFVFGTLAAKSRHAERIIIPLVDILQSVPILGFLAVSVPILIHAFPDSMLGPECAAIFAIFTSQAWNIMMGFYQSMRSVPSELKEAADVFHLSSWQRYWKVEVPVAVPSLLWNMMLSMSAGWFFVVASEAISVGHQTILLPGIGSYIAVAIGQANLHAIFYAIAAMFIVILMYDQLIFRPLVAWSEKFKAELALDDVVPESWVIDLFHRTRWFLYISGLFESFREFFINLPFSRREKRFTEPTEVKKGVYRLLVLVWYIALIAMIATSFYFFARFIHNTLPLHEVMHVVGLGFVTLLRVVILIVLCSVVWIPIGVWIGLRPRIASIVQPVAQFLAAFPAYLLFPLVVMTIVHFHLNVNIWTSPLMVLGTQWYILFNVIAGTSALPKELLLASRLFEVKGWLRWRTLILPAIFPYFVTGAMTAAGGAWNASIVAEVVSWGDVTLHATGLGAYISETTTAGDIPREALGVVVMCLFVFIINRLVWRPMYRLAEDRFHVE
jgi:NitT/TauT family transport system permease protein